jgi:hypothetical protein
MRRLGRLCGQHDRSRKAFARRPMLARRARPVDPAFVRLAMASGVSDVRDDLDITG